MCKLYRLEPTIESLTRQTCNMIVSTTIRPPRHLMIASMSWPAVGLFINSPCRQVIADEYFLFTLWVLAAIYRISVEPTKPTQAGDTRSVWERHRKATCSYPRHAVGHGRLTSLYYFSFVSATDVPIPSVAWWSHFFLYFPIPLFSPSP